MQSTNFFLDILALVFQLKAGYEKWTGIYNGRKLSRKVFLWRNYENNKMSVSTVISEPEFEGLYP
jgi:hypothetical protein